MPCNPCLPTFPWFYTKEEEADKRLVKPSFLNGLPSHSLKLSLYALAFAQGNEIVWNFCSFCFVYKTNDSMLRWGQKSGWMWARKKMSVRLQQGLADPSMSLLYTLTLGVGPCSGTSSLCLLQWSWDTHVLYSKNSCMMQMLSAISVLAWSQISAPTKQARMAAHCCVIGRKSHHQQCAPSKYRQEFYHTKLAVVSR